MHMHTISAVDNSEAPLVLVAEDHDDSRVIATRVLEHAGFRVIEATRGDNALSLAHKQKPDLILMDISMPGMDGWTATELLKADPDTAHILILIVTAYAFRGDREIAEKVGSDGYLTKPLSPSYLVRAVKDALASPPPPVVE